MATEREKDLEAWLEAEVRERMMAEAVTMTFHGTIKVDPNKVYVDRETGKRAAQALRERAERDGAVPMPRNEDEAVGMALIGESWLRHNAPHRLKANKENTDGR